MSKPNRTTQISQQELDILDTMEIIEYADGHSSDDLQQYLNF